MGGGSGIGVAHAEINNVMAAGARGSFNFVYFGEDIRRESLDAIKIVVHNTSFILRIRRLMDVLEHIRMRIAQNGYCLNFLENFG